MDDPREASALPSEVRTRSRVLDLTRGPAIPVEVWDELEKRGVDVPFPERHGYKATTETCLCWTLRSR